MLDRIDESKFYGRTPLCLDGLDRVVCLAPHPDDEVLGCGGLLCKLTLHGRHVRTILLTDGQAQAEGGYAVRRQESLSAAACLGLGPPEFLGLQDRHLRYNEASLQCLLDVIEAFRPTHLLAPSLSEPHPDHQSVALLSIAAALRLECDLVFYEAAAPLVPSHLLDISDVVDRKQAAMDCFKSQQLFHDYHLHATALGQLRAHGYPGPAKAVEAFFCLPYSELMRSGPAAARCDALSVRARLGLANAPSDLPLVSVIVRTIGRPSLGEALDSVSAQTYSAVEIVLIDAAKLQLNRAEAANEGIERAQGDFALFLDDDDLIEPSHISRLVSRLLAQPSAVAAYAGVRVVDHDAVEIGVYDQPWERERLEGANFIPIHAALFRLDVVRSNHLQFNPAWPVLEDWGFWLALSEFGPFSHCAGVSATYRKLDQGSRLSEGYGENHWETWQQRILEQRIAGRKTEAVVGTLAWHGRQLAMAAQTEWSLRQELNRISHEREQAVADLIAAKDQLVQGYEQQLKELMKDRERLSLGYEAQIRELAASRETLSLGYEQQLRDLVTARETLALGYEQQMRALVEQRSALTDELAAERARLSAVVGTRLWRWSRPLRNLFSRMTGQSR